MKKRELIEVKMQVQQRVDEIIRLVFSRLNVVHLRTDFRDGYAVVVFLIDDICVSSDVMSSLRLYYWQIINNKLFIYTNLFPND